MEKVTSFVTEVRSELTKITWPKYHEVVRLTIMVVLISALVGGFVGGLDFVFTKGLELWITR